MAVIPAGAAETKLTSVYASYAAEGHTNAPIEDDVFEAKSDSITVSILTTTDMHGRAYDWNSYTNSALSNNFLQAAKLVAERRAAVDDSILIDVGDILQGSALSSYNILQEGGENSPMATALRYIGYDAFVLGNHEFNYAPQIQWNYYNLLTSTDKAVAGQPVDVICSNVVETETNESVFSPYKTFTYKFEDGTTFTIGLLGFENMNNANWDVASHYEGCTFGHTDNAEKSYVYEWENFSGNSTVLSVSRAARSAIPTTPKSPMSMSGKTTTARKCRRSATTSSSPCTVARAILTSTIRRTKAATLQRIPPALTCC